MDPLNYGDPMVKGVRISALNNWMIFLAAILYGCLLFATMYVYDECEALVASTHRYIDLERQGDIISNASDYLTDQVRFYVRIKDPAYIDLYFQEINVNQRREKALEDLYQIPGAATYQQHLIAAVQRSKDLMKTECYAMRLVAESEGLPLDDWPELQAVQLTEGDAALSPAQKLEKGRAMVFDVNYQDDKRAIERHLSNFAVAVLDQTEIQLMASVDEVLQAARAKQMLLSVLFVLNLLTFGGILYLVVRPLKRFIINIQEQTLLDETGSYEFQYLASVYNGIYEENAANAAKEARLIHKIEHDALTGLMNRHVFSGIDEVLGQSTVPLALMIIDVDHFKDINDTYGHETGDRVLKKVASVLAASFRAGDYIFRYGGDEFVGIVTNITEAQSGVIQEKVGRMNTILQTPEDGMPVVTLSVGVAFSETGYHEALFNHADKALYWVKRQGRCGCQFYKSEAPPLQIEKEPGESL